MNCHVEVYRAHVVQAAALAFIRKDKSEQVKAGKREHVALAAHVWTTVHSSDEQCATTPRVKREAFGERACGPAYKLRSKKNRAERIAARA